jgi:hypothetical protein
MPKPDTFSVKKYLKALSGITCALIQQALDRNSNPLKRVLVLSPELIPELSASELHQFLHGV